MTSTAAAEVRISSYFNIGDIDYLFDSVARSFEKMYVSTFCSRKNINLDEAINLAMELPAGAFIAGGFVKSVAIEQPIKDYDIFFSSAESLKALVRRIQHAPEGSALHGYVSNDSLRSFADSDAKYIMFTHPTKPPLQLVRVRWYGRPEEAIDKFDLSMCQFALDHELNMTFSTNGWNDARHRVARLLAVAFPLATGLRLWRFLDQGYTFQGNIYLRDDYLRLAQEFMTERTRAATRAGLPAPINTDGFGSFEP